MAVVSSSFNILNINNFNNKNTLNIHTTYKYNIYMALFLKNLLNNLYSIMDFTFLLGDTNTTINSYACFLTNERVLIYTFLPKFKKLRSISKFYKSAQWVEREIQEFNSISICGVTDSRRLLTDYVYHKQLNTSKYKLDSYNLISQNIY